MIRVLILLIALGAGGAAAWIAMQETPQPAPVPQPEPQPAPEMAEVLVAAQEIPRGEEVTPAALRWRPWPADAVVDAFISRAARPEAAEALSGRVAARRIPKGEPMREQALAREGTGYLAAMLEPGKRAVAIRASAESTAGGFILPDDRVDVLHTADAMVGGGNREVRSRIILRGVRVLAIDQTVDEMQSGTVLGKTATLELTEDQTEVLAAAQATGTLSLALRPLGEEIEAEEPRRTIRVHRGGRVETVEVD